MEETKFAFFHLYFIYFIRAVLKKDFFLTKR